MGAARKVQVPLASAKAWLWQHTQFFRTQTCHDRPSKLPNDLPACQARTDILRVCCSEAQAGLNPTPQIPTVLGGQGRPLNHLSAGVSCHLGTGHPQSTVVLLIVGATVGHVPAGLLVTLSA